MSAPSLQSAELLRWAGQPLGLEAQPSIRFPQLVPLHDGSVGLVYITRIGALDVLFSAPILDPFGPWPPRLGESVEHYRGDFHSTVGRVSSLADGTFSLRLLRFNVVAKVGVANAQLVLTGTSLVLDRETGHGLSIRHDASINTFVVERYTTLEEGSTELMATFPAPKAKDAAVARMADGSVLLALGPEGIPTRPGTISLHRIRPDGSVKNGAKIKVPFTGEKKTLLRRGDGAWLAIAGRSTGISVYRIDETMKVVGDPWVRPPGLAPPDIVAFRDGFLVAESNTIDGVTLIASDGARDVTVVERVGVGGVTHRSVAMAVNEAHDAILVAYPMGLACEIARAQTVSREEAATRSDWRVPIERSASARPAAPPRSPPPPARRPTRDRVVQNALLHAVAQAISADMHSPRFRFEGDATKGLHYFENGQGDHALVAWNERGVVALEFNHESVWSEWRRNISRRNPARRFCTPPPPELSALVEKACQWGERLATSALWIHGEDSSETLPLPRSDFEQLFELMFTAEESAGQEPRPGQWLAGVSPLVRDLAAAIAAGQHELTPDQADLVLFKDARLRNPRRWAPIELADVACKVKALKKLGIRWSGAEAHAKRVNAAHERALASVARGAHDLALLGAAAKGDLAAARDALDRGASLACVSRAGEFEHYSSATPLELALLRRHREVAKLLLERGANPNLDSAPIHWVVQLGDAEMCRLMVLSGARLDAGPGRHAALYWAQQNRNAEVIRLLLDAGAPLPSEEACEALREVVTKVGATDLVPRLTRG